MKRCCPRDQRFLHIAAVAGAGGLVAVVWVENDAANRRAA